MLRGELPSAGVIPAEVIRHGRYAGGGRAARGLAGAVRRRARAADLAARSRPRHGRGALLSPGRRTVTSALRAAGLGNAPGFATYHRVPSEGRWSGLALAERLLALLVAAFAPHGPVVESAATVK